MYRILTGKPFSHPYVTAYIKPNRIFWAKCLPVRASLLQCTYPGLCREEDFEVVAAGQDRVVGHAVQELVESLPPCVDEVIVEPLHHPLHHKLLWKWLRIGHKEIKVCSRGGWATIPGCRLHPSEA